MMATVGDCAPSLSPQPRWSFLGRDEGDGMLAGDGHDGDESAITSKNVVD